MNTSSQILKHLRLERGFSAREVARQLAINAGVVSQWERGRRPVPRAQRLALAALYDVDPWLIDILHFEIPSDGSLTVDPNELVEWFRSRQAPF